MNNLNEQESKEIVNEVMKMLDNPQCKMIRQCNEIYTFKFNGNTLKIDIWPSGVHIEIGDGNKSRLSRLYCTELVTRLRDGSTSSLLRALKSVNDSNASKSSKSDKRGWFESFCDFVGDIFD